MRANAAGPSGSVALNGAMLDVSYKIPPPPRVNVFTRHAIDPHSKRERQREAKPNAFAMRWKFTLGLLHDGPEAKSRPRAMIAKAARAAVEVL